MILIPISEKELRDISIRYRIYEHNIEEQLDVLLEILEADVLKNILQKGKYEYEIIGNTLMLIIDENKEFDDSIDKFLKSIRLLMISNTIIGPFKEYKLGMYIYSNCVIYKDEDYVVIKFKDRTLELKYEYFIKQIKDFLKYSNIIENEEYIINVNYIHTDKYSINVKKNKVIFKDYEVDINIIKDIVKETK